jgi:hypothetical protein
MRIKQKKLSPFTLYLVSPEFTRLLVKFDALLLASLIILSQTT